MKTYLKRAVMWVASVAVVAGVATTFVSYGEVEAQNPEIKVVDLTPEKIEVLKTDLVERLTQCEGMHYTEEDAIVTYDNNPKETLRGKNVWSFGLLQWKVSTIQSQVKLRDGKDITQKEAVLLALDTSEAQALAKYTIFSGKDAKGIGHWHGCAEKHDLYGEVKMIQRLEK